MMVVKREPPSRSKARHRNERAAKVHGVEKPSWSEYTTKQTLLQNRALPGFDSCLTSCTRRNLGAVGELNVSELLQDAGYKSSNRRLCGGDHSAIDPDTGEIIVVETKTARRGADGKWRFTLYKKGSTDHRKSDVVVLLAVYDKGSYTLFVIPTADIANQHAICISSHPESYKGKWAKYRMKADRFKLPEVRYVSA